MRSTSPDWRMPLTFHSGSCSVGLSWSVDLSRSSVQFVTQWRAALHPVSRLQRDGELMLEA